jgi:hypothetical protein
MRYKRAVRAEIDACIRDAGMLGLSHDKTIQFIQERTGLTIGHTQLVDRKRLLKIRGKVLWNTFRKDDYALRLRHLDRIQEAELVAHGAARKVLEYQDNPKTFFQWKAAAYALMEASRYLCELDEMTREIDGVGLSGYEENNKPSATISAATSDSEAIF